MKSKKRINFAERLALGELRVPSRISWWPRHAASLLEYLQGRSGKSRDITRRLRRVCQEMGREWGAILPAGEEFDQAAELMSIHADCEVTLIDMVWEGVGTTELRSQADLLTENLTAQAMRYPRLIEGFPSARFGMLVTDHVTTLLDCVGAYADGHLRRFNGALDRWRANAGALAAFSAEWF